MIARTLALIAMLSVPLAAPAWAQQDAGQTPMAPRSADDQRDPARYELRDSEDGVVRLDRQTGAMSFCTSAGGKLVCRLGADEREAYQQALAALEERLKSAEDRLELLESRATTEMAPNRKKQDRLPRPSEELQGDNSGSGDGETKTDKDEPPTTEEREFDRALEFSQRAMRRFFEVIQDLRREMESEEEPAR